MIKPGVYPKVCFECGSEAFLDTNMPTCFACGSWSTAIDHSRPHDDGMLFVYDRAFNGYGHTLMLEGRSGDSLFVVEVAKP